MDIDKKLEQLNSENNDRGQRIEHLNKTIQEAKEEINLLVKDHDYVRGQIAMLTELKKEQEDGNTNNE